MNVTIDKVKAEAILRDSIEQVLSGNWSPSGSYSNEIKEVILGRHKTYRYILLNGILAKSTNGACNPLSIQAGADLIGAFDARSLCHDVIVPIEREILGDRLGASNEPFMNKPARFPSLSLNNAVRRGRDMEMLRASYNVLSSLTSEDDALIALKDCVYWVFKREPRDLEVFLSTKERGESNSSLLSFSSDVVSLSLEGESCALLAGAIFEIIAVLTGRSLEVRTHKVNQSGASSKETSDIDVYEDSVLVLTAEVKDKRFHATDVGHAVSKVISAGLSSLIFIKGPRAILVDDAEDALKDYWKERGVNIYFVSILEYLAAFASVSSEIEKEVFVHWINKHADSAKVKDETITHLKECILKHDW